MKKLKFKLVSTDSTGLVKVLINGRRYSYLIGGHQVHKVREMAKRKQGAALNYLKKAAGNNFSKGR